MMGGLTLARKISGISLNVWEKGLSFDPKQLTTSNLCISHEFSLIG